MLSGGVKSVAAGDFHSMVIKEDGSIWVTESNKDGQFGDGSTKPEKSFVKLLLFQTDVGHKTYIWTAAFVYSFALSLSSTVRIVNIRKTPPTIAGWTGGESISDGLDWLVGECTIHEFIRIWRMVSGDFYQYCCETFVTDLMKLVLDEQHNYFERRWQCVDHYLYLTWWRCLRHK